MNRDMGESFFFKTFFHRLIILLSILLVISTGTPAGADDDHFGFVVMGDSRGNGCPAGFTCTDKTGKTYSGTGLQIHKSVLGGLVNEVIKLHASLATNKPEFLFFLGDLCNQGGKNTCLDDWKSVMKPLLGMAPKIPYFVTIGNHELYKTKKEPSNTPWVLQEEFRANLNGPPDPLFYADRQHPAGMDNLAFSFRKGNSLFIILDAYDVSPRMKTIMPPQVGYFSDAQFDWLKTVLEKNKSIKHKFVFAHVPILIPTGGCSGMNNACRNFKKIDDLLDQYKADTFFAGHDHLFAIKNCLGACPQKKNCIHITSGRAGAPGRGKTPYPYDVQNHDIDHFLYVRIDDQDVYIDVYGKGSGDPAYVIKYRLKNGIAGNI